MDTGDSHFCKWLTPAEKFLDEGEVVGFFGAGRRTGTVKMLPGFSTEDSKDSGLADMELLG